MSDRFVRVPVRVARPGEKQAVPEELQTGRAPKLSSTHESALNPESGARLATDSSPGAKRALDVAVGADGSSPLSGVPGSNLAEGEWRDRALRLQAEMDNYRKRQQRLAQDQIQTERQRLLRGFLRVVDDLERALAAPSGCDQELRHGILLTHHSALNFLESEGVKPLDAVGRAFDPLWHDAVAVAQPDGGVEPGTVTHVVETGYRLGGELLRPARVVVAS